MGASSVVGQIIGTAGDILPKWMGRQGDQNAPGSIAPPGPTPTPQNSSGVLDDAASAQRKAQGAKATIFGGANGGLLSPGSSSSKQLLLGS